MRLCHAAPPRRARRLVSLAIAAVLAAGLATAAPATPASASTHHLTASRFVEWSTGRTLGPSYWTGYGRAVVTGWPDRILRNSKVRPAVKITRGINPTTVTAGIVRPDSWWNPTTWHWSQIFGSAWHWISKCLVGAEKGVVPSVGGVTAVNLLFRGAKLYVGPYGYAAIAVGGCLSNIIGN